MGSVASDIGNFVSDTVSSVGDIGQSIIDEGTQVIESVGSGISDAAQSVSDAFAQIDPGPAIGEAGAAVDQVVNDVIPGGWYMVGAVALTVATMGSVNLEGEALAAGAAAEGAEIIAATTAAEAAAAGTAAAEGVAAASATTAAAASGSTAAQAALQAAATGALKGAAIGAAKSAITGGDILDGAINGALTGAIGGGIGSYASGLTAGTDLADYAKTVGAVAGGTAGGATGAALNGRDPLTGALIGGISGGTSSIASNIVPTDINPAITSGVLGAAKSAIMGGDPLMGGLTSAGGSLINQGVNAGYDAIKGALPDFTTPSSTPVQTADSGETQYAPLASNVTSDQPDPLVPSNTQGVSVSEAAFTSPFLLDDKGNLMYGPDGQLIPNPLLNQSTTSEGVTSTADRGSPLSQSQIDAANQLESKLTSGEISQQEYDQQLSAIENQQSPLDSVVIADAVDKIYTGSGGLPTSTPNLPSGYSLQPPDVTDGMPRAYTTDMPPDGSTWAYNNTTGDRIAVPVDGNANAPTTPSDNTTVSDNTTPSTGGGSNSSNDVGKFLGDVAGGLSGVLGGIFGGSGTGTGTGTGGTGAGGSGSGTGTGIRTGTGGLSSVSQGSSDANAGLVNLQPGLTKPMDYDLAGLPHFAIGGSTTSSIFDSKGNYNYGNLSDTPLTAALTKHNVGYKLTGLPSKAEGGIIQHMAGGGQFGTSGSYFGSSGNFGVNERLEHSQETAHQPQFFSEGGASMANRYVKGGGDGTSDSIPAMLANGEFVIPADVVSNLGNGSNDSGAKILDEFLRVIREHKRKADVRHLPPDSKGPLSYLTDAKRKVRK